MRRALKNNFLELITKQSCFTTFGVHVFSLSKWDLTLDESSGGRRYEVYGNLWPLKS